MPRVETALTMKKMAASASARADRREVARLALRELLQHVGLLARTLRADGGGAAFQLPRTKSAVTLLTAGRQFAVDVKPFDAGFAGHGVGSAQIASATAAYEQAMNTQGVSRTEHVAARAHIRGQVAAAVRAVRRLDLIIANDLRGNDVIQAQWKQLRRVEDPRGTRGASGSGGDSPATPHFNQRPGRRNGGCDDTHTRRRRYRTLMWRGPCQVRVGGRRAITPAPFLGGSRAERSRVLDSRATDVKRLVLITVCWVTRGTSTDRWLSTFA